MNEISLKQLDEKIMSLKDFFETFNQINQDRHDSHGQQMREGFSKIYDKLDDLKNENNTRINDLDKRVTIIETKKLSFREMLATLLAIIGGVSGLFALIDKFVLHY